MRGALLALLLAACVHKEELQLDASHAEHDQLAGNVSMRVDSAEHAKLDEHELVTAGPGERIDRDFAPLPDGGVYLAHEAEVHWGGSTSENWLKTSLNAEEHLEVDAGVLEEHAAAGELHEREVKETHPAASCAVGGYLWALAVIGICIVILGGIAKFRPKP